MQGVIQLAQNQHRDQLGQAFDVLWVKRGKRWKTAELGLIVGLVDLAHRVAFAVDRRLSGKKYARGAFLSTAQSLLQVEHHGLRVRQMAVIESWSEAEC
jgi:hypothetical protein